MPSRTPTSVVVVELLTNLVLPPGTKAYAVTLACGCSSTVFDPPEIAPAVGESAVCRSADGSHLILGPTTRRQETVLSRLWALFRRGLAVLVSTYP